MKKFKEAIGQKSDRKDHTRYRYEMMSELISNAIKALTGIDIRV